MLKEFIAALGLYAMCSCATTQQVQIKEEPLGKIEQILSDVCMEPRVSSEFFGCGDKYFIDAEGKNPYENIAQDLVEVKYQNIKNIAIKETLFCCEILIEDKQGNTQRLLLRDCKQAEELRKAINILSN